MLGWFQAIMPKEDKFFDLFEQHATLVVAGAEALRSLLQGRRRRSRIAARRSSRCENRPTKSPGRC